MFSNKVLIDYDREIYVHNSYAQLRKLEIRCCVPLLEYDKDAFNRTVERQIRELKIKGNESACDILRAKFLYK